MADLIKEGKALPLPDLVMLAVDLLNEATAAFEQPGPHNVAACKKAQDALMFGMLIGFFYPQRESSIMGVSHPYYDGLCQHPECATNFCKGNR